MPEQGGLIGRLCVTVRPAGPADGVWECGFQVLPTNFSLFVLSAFEVASFPR